MWRLSVLLRLGGRLGLLDRWGAVRLRSSACVCCECRVGVGSTPHTTLVASLSSPHMAHPTPCSQEDAVKLAYWAQGSFFIFNNVEEFHQVFVVFIGSGVCISVFVVKHAG